MLNNIGWDGRLHRWRGSKTCSQAYLSEAGSPQIFSLWVVHIIKEESVWLVSEVLGTLYELRGYDTGSIPVSPPAF